jgi:hypothetical protein
MDKGDDKYHSLQHPIPISEAVSIIEQELIQHTRHEHILMSKKIKKGKLPPKEIRKDFAGSVFWKDPRRLRSDHWIEFLIFGKPKARRIYARASKWEYELKHEKLELVKIWEAVEAELSKLKVKIEAD